MLKNTTNVVQFPNTQPKKTLKSVSLKPETCDKCDEKPAIVSYGKKLCCKHGLEHLKSLERSKNNGILF